jgi:hypothetical protein
MFLSGELPARLLKEAQLWVSEEQGCEPPASIEDPIMTTEHPGDPSCVPQASSNGRYEPIQASLVITSQSETDAPCTLRNSRTRRHLSHTPGRTASLASWNPLANGNNGYRQSSTKLWRYKRIRASDGQCLLPKGILKAAWQADPLRKALLLERDPAPFRRKRGSRCPGR